MNIYFILWLLMTACSVALIIINNRQKKIIDEYKSLASLTSSGDTADINELKKTIEGLQLIKKEQEESIKTKDLFARQYRKEIDRLRKLSADFVPMKTMAEYREKIMMLSEQAEDMFGLYIDRVEIVRHNSMWVNYWDVDIKITSGIKPEDKPMEEETDK